MAVPRPVLLALLGLALIASVFLVTRSGSNESVSGPARAGAKPFAAPTAARPVHAPTPAPRKAAPSAPKRHAAPAKPAKPVAKHPKPATKPAAVPGAANSAVAARVLAAAKALGEDKVVVFFFSGPGAADDAAASAALRSLHGMSRVEIFDAGLAEVAAYRPMLSNVGISQIPSTVIVRPGKRAVLLQGFVDAGTLRQNVADALR